MGAIIMLVLQIVLNIGPKLITWLLNKKALDQKQAEELQKRFKEAIEISKAKAGDPDNIKDQYDNAKVEAQKKWKELETPPQP